MSLNIRPHPDHPNGGYAQLELPAEAISGDEVLVAVFDTYSERHLGENDWQATPVEFGPYPAEPAGETVRVRIGPEIVNQIEEYAALRITLNGKKWDVDWPDTIIQLPGAAKIGGLHSRGAKEAPRIDNLVGKKPEPAPVMAPVDDTTASTTDPVVDPEEETGNSHRAQWIGLGIVLLAIAGAAAWYFLSASQPEPAPVATLPEPAQETVTATAADPCAPDQITALDGQPFTAVQTALAGCGAAVSADAALKLIENAADRNDAAALEAFGEAYDGGQDTNPIESVIGVTFADTPAVAADYYIRARDAGSDSAAAKLQSLCERIAGATDTLSQTAFRDYCN
ncbi:MAG: hypothetical protein KDE08_04015 [Rhodobacteraceae bacterium]|nr:hypothetical protein [Paracoccaceae bacterium]